MDEVRFDAVTQQPPSGAVVRSSDVPEAAVGEAGEARRELQSAEIEAVKQPETGLYLKDTPRRGHGMKQLGSCDFDADGVADRFMATGARRMADVIERQEESVRRFLELNGDEFSDTA